MMVSNRNISFSTGGYFQVPCFFFSFSKLYHIIPNIFIMSGWRVFPSLRSSVVTTLFLRFGTCSASSLWNWNWNQNENQLSHEKKWPLVVLGICWGMKSHPRLFRGLFHKPKKKDPVIKEPGINGKFCANDFEIPTLETSRCFLLIKYPLR